MERIIMKDMFKYVADANNISLEDMMKFNNSLKSYETMCKTGMNLYFKLLKNTAVMSKSYLSMLEKLIEKNNQPHKAKNDKPGCFPANGHDIYNYVARYNMSSLQIQVILKFDDRLDFDTLKNAVRLSVEAEPVFKCRFIEDEQPYWKPLDNISMVDFCSLETTNNINQSIKDYIESPMNIDIDPVVKLKLFRSPEYDVLVLKINHVCCDGAGVLEYVQLLADIYTEISKENGNYTPVPRISGRTDQDRLFSQLGVTNMDSLFVPGSDISMPTWPFPWEQGSSKEACMSVRRLSGEDFDAIRKYAKSKGFTLNDLILTACYRAMHEMGEPIYGMPMEIPITVDLRRYLPDRKTKAIRNFSGSVITKLAMQIDEPFNETLQRVSSMMNDIKGKYPGLQSAIGLERIEKLNFYETLAYYQVSPEFKDTSAFCPIYSGDKCVPTLSNIGYISRSIIKFGDNAVNDAYLLPPAVRPTGLLILACTYNSVMTLAAGYFKYTVSKVNIDKLLNKMRDELVEGCKE